MQQWIINCKHYEIHNELRLTETRYSTIFVFRETKRAGRSSIPLRHVIFYATLSSNDTVSLSSVYLLSYGLRRSRENIGRSHEYFGEGGKDRRKEAEKRTKKNLRIVLAIVKRNPWAPWERSFLRGRLPCITRFFRELYYHPCLSIFVSSLLASSRGIFFEVILRGFDRVTALLNSFFPSAREIYFPSLLR